MVRFCTKSYYCKEIHVFICICVRTDETFLSAEDPTPAETSSQDKHKQSTLVLLVAVVAAGAVVVTSIIIAGIVVVCKHRPKPPEPQEVRKRMR